MSYAVPRLPEERDRDFLPQGEDRYSGLPLWEVFIRQRRGMSHIHAGSLHASDPEMALQSARDVYTRRGEGISLWVVRSSDITASDADEAGSLFEPTGSKPYRDATFYQVPSEVEWL